MKRISLAFILIFCVGACNPTPFIGSVKVNKIDGQTSTIDVTTPSFCTLKSREEANKYIANLESLLVEVKAARDSMPVNEPQPQPAK